MELPAGRVTFSRDQLRFAGLWVAGFEGASSVDACQREDGGLDLTVYDKTGEVIGTKTIQGDDNRLE